MFRTEGLSTIATTTDLRTNAPGVLEALKSGGVLVQRNGRPQAVLLSFEDWKAIRPHLDTTTGRPFNGSALPTNGNGSQQGSA